MTSALTLSASEHVDVGQPPMTSDISVARQAVVWAYTMTILRYADSSWADGPSTVRRPD